MSQGDEEDPEAKVEQMAQVTDADAGIWKATVELEQQRTEEELKGRKSLTEPEGTREPGRAVD